MNATSKPLVMLIDDDPSHLKLYAWVIERGGFAAHTVLASGSLESLPLVAASLCILDYRLGPIDPVQVARRVREVCPNIPILILSDSAWMPDEFSGLTSEFVRKGDPEQLLDRIQALVVKS